MSELHKTELDKNHKLEEKFTKNQLQKLELQKKYNDKEEKFNDNLDYLYYAIIIGCSVIFLVDRKIETENKRLDKLERKKTSPNSRYPL